MKAVKSIIASLLVFGLLIIPTSIYSQTQNDTDQFIQLKKYASELGKGVSNNLFVQSNDVTGWKEMLAIAVAINEGYTNDPSACG
jgi:hypothetical protein